MDNNQKNSIKQLVKYFVFTASICAIVSCSKTPEKKGWELGAFGMRHLWSEDSYRSAPDLGGTWASHSIFLIRGRIETRPGFMDWALSDSLILKSLEYNVEPIPMFVSIDWKMLEDPKIAESDIVRGPYTHPSHYPKDKDAWQTFVRRFVERYDGDGNEDISGLQRPVNYWGIEVEFPRIWRESPKKYRDYLRITSEAIREANPNAVITIAGLAGAHFNAFRDGYFPDLEKIDYKGKEITKEEMINYLELLDRMNQIDYLLDNDSPYYDICNIHFLGIGLDYVFIPPVVQWVSDRMQAAGYSKPIVSFESGILYNESDYTDQKNAEGVVKLFAVGLGAGLSGMTWMVDSDNPVWGFVFVHLSLLSPPPDCERKPSFYSYQAMTQILKGYTEVNNVSQDNGIFGYQFMKPEESVFIYWSELEPTPSIEISGQAITILDIYGNIMQETTSGSLDLDLTTAPIYIRVK